MILTKHQDMDMIGAYLEYLRNGDERERKRKPCSDDTWNLRRKILTRLHKDLPLGVARTSQAELEEWLANPDFSENTQATYWVALKSAYDFWADPRDPWINENPTANMTPLRFREGVARPGAEADLALVLDRGVEPYRTWVAIAAYQGLRCCEIAGLDREHVTARRLLVVRGKGGRRREHDTDPLVWEAVRDFPPGPLARDHRTGERATAGYVSRTANRYMREQLGIDVTMHMWRHRLGVQAQRLYKNLRVTQELLGHRSAQSTLIYTRADYDELRAARAMLPRPDHAA